MQLSPGHHQYFKRVTPCGVTLRTKLSNGVSDVNADILGKMARQCQILGIEFQQLVACPLSEDDWDALVAERQANGTLPFPKYLT